MKFLVATLILLAGCASSYTIKVDGKRLQVEIRQNPGSDGHGVAIVTDASHTVKEIRILYCTPPAQDSFSSTQADAAFSAAIEGVADIEARTEVAQEFRKKSNHTNTTLLIDYAFFRVCELLTSGQVTPEQADMLLKTLLAEAGRVFVTSGSSDSKTLIDKTIEDMFSGKRPN